jgi:predicted dehydrogenase
MANSICNVAIVGAGYMAREHIRAFLDISSVKVTGIYSRTRAKAEALALEYGIETVCDSVAELYEQTQANLVVVAVPELEVNAVCQSCFKYSWAALIEKPAGYNLEDAEEIEAVARRLERRAYVALNRRHYGSTQVVLQDLGSQIGPRLIKIQDQEGPTAALAAGQPELVVRNWMYANSIHLIDYFSLLGRGNITRVEPTIRYDPKSPRYVAATITFDSGDLGLYEAVWDGPGPWTVSVNADAKRWELRPLEKAAFQLAGARTLQPVEDHPWDTQFKPGLRRQAEQAALAALGQPADLPTLRDALASMRLTNLIYS